MRRQASLLMALMMCLQCGGSSKPKPKSPDELSAEADGGETDAAPAGADGGPAPAANACTGADIDLLNALIQSACEVKTPPPDAKPRDVSATLDVKINLSTGTVAPGGHVDLTVVFTNKSQAPLPLDFLLDPTPRFTVETYNAKNNRADVPHTKPPHVKNDGPAPDPTAAGTAEVTLPPGGKASVRVPWDAVKLKWAPEKVKGTPPEMGFPTSPAGPLAKGTYLLKVVTPLIGIFEGAAHDTSAPKISIKVQ